MQYYWYCLGLQMAQSAFFFLLFDELTLLAEVLLRRKDGEGLNIEPDYFQNFFWKELEKTINSKTH